MNITASIQARMGSTRLPGKVLKSINDKPMLLWQIDRIKRSRLIDNIIVATSNSELDNKIVELCIDNEIQYFRGSENDVLARVANLLEINNVDIHVECYGDSPLIDPQLIDESIGIYFKYKDQADYFSSSIKTTFPPGLEFSIYDASILVDVNRRISADDPLREHVGFNITRFEDYKIFSIEAPPSLQKPELYLEVDTKEDFELINIVINHFISINKLNFSAYDLVEFFEKNPELSLINNKVERRWKKLRND